MYLEFPKRPAIIVEHKTQYLSHNLHFFRGGVTPPPVTEKRVTKRGLSMLISQLKMGILFFIPGAASTASP